MQDEWAPKVITNPPRPCASRSADPTTIPKIPDEIPTTFDNAFAFFVTYTRTYLFFRASTLSVDASTPIVDADFASTHMRRCTISLGFASTPNSDTLQNCDFVQACAVWMDIVVRKVRIIFIRILLASSFYFISWHVWLLATQSWKWRDCFVLPQKLSYKF